MALSEWSDGNERDIRPDFNTEQWEEQFRDPCGDRRKPSPNVVHTEDARMLENLLEVIGEKTTALDVQVGGQHYKSRGIQPVTYIHANGLDFFEGSAIKYITRWRQKGGKADLDKAIHFLELLKELEPDT